MLGKDHSGRHLCDEHNAKEVPSTQPVEKTEEETEQQERTQPQRWSPSAGKKRWEEALLTYEKERCEKLRETATTTNVLTATTTAATTLATPAETTIMQPVEKTEEVAPAVGLEAGKTQQQHKQQQQSEDQQ